MGSWPSSAAWAAMGGSEGSASGVGSSSATGKPASWSTTARPVPRRGRPCQLPWTSGAGKISPRRSPRTVSRSTAASPSTRLPRGNTRASPSAVASSELASSSVAAGAGRTRRAFSSTPRPRWATLTVTSTCPPTTSPRRCVPCSTWTEIWAAAGAATEIAGVNETRPPATPAARARDFPTMKTSPTRLPAGSPAAPWRAPRRPRLLARDRPGRDAVQAETPF